MNIRKQAGFTKTRAKEPDRGSGKKRTKSRRRKTMASQAFLQARDFLLRHRDDYATAYKDFAWPELTEFNWALDWFDEYARSNLAPALWVVEENGDETKLSFAELSARSNQLANWLRQQGVQRGDRILLMLPNQPALWETMLAAMKLGAVTIPATMLLTPADIADRMTRGEVKRRSSIPSIKPKPASPSLFRRALRCPKAG
jgi:hypothetical protein